MKIKIETEEFDVSNELVTTMLDMMEKTAKTGHELGFLMCQPNETLLPGKKCTGNKCSILLEDCGGKPVAGSFHTHPTVMSFSQPDYLHGFERAKTHPEQKHLLCVSLVDKGMRCKALKELPPPGKTFPILDTEENREMVKPYWTKRVNISLEQLAKLLAGVPWDELPPAEAVIAEDEGEDICASGKKECLEPGGEASVWWPEEPTGVYPWSTKPQFKSVKTPMGIAMEPIPPAEILSPETEFIDIKTIETPDPSLIHKGEVGGYVNALVPIQLLKEKDDQGRWKIHDGRHRVVAWRVAGYKQIPVVFVKP